MSVSGSHLLWPRTQTTLSTRFSLRPVFLPPLSSSSLVIPLRLSSSASITRSLLVSTSLVPPTSSENSGRTSPRTSTFTEAIPELLVRPVVRTSTSTILLPTSSLA
uniref:Uncharacterized protein n=1 Tax=Cryptococcus bacillisporus CA1280 TaxID=1296109 RepID=A0A0D0TD69_CRYGA|nr:hypothetical protein I312_06577 [Cryptococcus bacillisporus CA1280]